MRMIVTGIHGQVSRTLVTASAISGFDIVTLGRPQMDLAIPSSIEPAVRDAKPQVIVSAAAYTAVDKAETDKAAAFAINAVGVEELARVARQLGVPIIHLSTDYVFDGEKRDPYLETDVTNPINVYGQSKLAGEDSLRRSAADHVVLRTSWVYSEYGQNFVKTMLRLAQARDEISVVDDQIGGPTSAHEIAAAILQVANNLMSGRASRNMWGTFHFCGRGDASWASFAEEIFRISATLGGPSARVRNIPSADFPTAARRPTNSTLCTDRIADIHGIAPPHWSESVGVVIRRILS